MAGKENKEKRPFTDRESGTYGGLMLSLRKYRDRLEPHPAKQLSKKPRVMDCLIIDTVGPKKSMDNDIARIFSRHNIIELKNPNEALNVDVLWKAVSYAAQYKSEGTPEGETMPVDDVTITVIRSAKPAKAFRLLREEGFSVEGAYPGIYYIKGMSAFAMQVVVTRELKGREYAPLRLQRKNASREDYEAFAEGIQSEYTENESEYVECVVRYGIYDEENGIIEMIREGSDMLYEQLMELFREEHKEEIEEARAEGKKEGREEGKIEGREEGKKEGREEGRKEERAKGEAERKAMQKKIQRLEKELKKAKVAML